MRNGNDRSLGGDATQTHGYESVYLRVGPERADASSDDPLGVPVDCTEVFEETEELIAVVYDGVETRTLVSVERRKVAYPPVADPTSVTLTRCGEHYEFNGETTKSATYCVADTEVEFTSDSRVVVECERETTRPAGYLGYNAGQGGVLVHSYEHIYIHEEPAAADTSLGVVVECDEVLEWESVGGGQYRWSVAYLPVADPYSVTVTRCGEYSIGTRESTYSDACVSSKGVSFTEDFEVLVTCESSTVGYERIYYRVD